MRRTKRRAQLLLGSKQRGLPVAKSLRHPSDPLIPGTGVGYS
jgi:hypothetical protein